MSIELKTITPEARLTAYRQALEARERDYVLAEINLEVAASEADRAAHEARLVQLKQEVETLQDKIAELE